jgi:hypothetical protein
MQSGLSGARQASWTARVPGCRERYLARSSPRCDAPPAAVANGGGGLTVAAFVDLIEPRLLERRRVVGRGHARRPWRLHAQPRSRSLGIAVSLGGAVSFR